MLMNKGIDTFFEIFLVLGSGTSYRTNYREAKKKRDQDFPPPCF